MKRLLLVLLVAACTRTTSEPDSATTGLEEVARSDRQWTGIAVSKTGRIFVNYPRWSDDVPFSVGELDEEGEAQPFPDRFWNAWDEERAPADHFV